MAKVKYLFNPHSLTYERYAPNFWRKSFRILGFLCLTFSFAIGLLIIIYNFYDSPKEKQLKREVAFYKVQMKMLNKKADHLSQVLGGLEERDDNIYRVIFEAEPIPQSIRKAGYGGTEDYRHLHGYYNSETLVNLHEKLDKLSKEMYIQSKSYDEISHLATRKTEMLSAIPAIQPVSNEDLRRIASGFGYRIHPIYKTKRLHSGLDFSAPQGTEVYATGNGKVVELTHDRRGYGIHIVVDHGYGYETLYAHLSETEVRRGQEVKRGEIIGKVGNTGVSTAPHLHYEVLKDGRQINPINYFYNDLSPEEYATVVELANQENQSFD